MANHQYRKSSQSTSEDGKYPTWTEAPSCHLHAQVKISYEGEHSQRQIPQNNGILAGAENVLINGGTFNVTHQHYKNYDDKWMELLRSNTAAGAFHNSDDRRDPPKCHPHTREAVIKDIMDWVIDGDRKEQFCWIYGPAGSGKSSIAQTIAELCEEQGRLASSFFFARTVPGRNSYTHLIATLAYQLALFIPDIREYMAEVIQADGLIFTRSLPTQLDTVILKPLARLTSCNCNNSDQKPRKKPYPYLVIIDGLDECDGHQNQSYILSSFSSILKTTSVSLIFLVASRPEHAIRVAFNGGLHEHTRRLVLDKEYHPNEDIRVYLKSEFDEIKRVHPLASSIPSDWPATSQVENIVHNASGQFIYASTVVKFIKYHRDRPTKRLDIVLNNFSPGNHTPFADLDALYGHILSPDESMIETVLSLFAFMFATAKMDTGLAGRQSTQTPDFIEAFLGHEPGELLLALADLHSIVDVPSVQQSSEGVSTTRPLRLFHASLGDFLLDKRRSGRLYIDMEAYYTRFAIRCMTHLTPWLRLSASLPGSLGRDSSSLISFAHPAFLHFLTSIDTVNEELLHELSKFPMDLFFGNVFQDECQAFTLVPTLFHWAKSKKYDLHNIFTDHYSSQIKVCLSDTNINFPQHILTGLALAVSMALDVSVQQSGIGVEKTLGLTVPVTKTTLPLSHSMPLSFFDHASDEKLLETTARRTQRRISDGVAYIMRAFDPKRGTNWWLFLGIVPNNTQLPFRDLYARINHYLRLVHFLTHEDYTDGLSTVDNTKYLIDSRKVSDFAIRLFDILTADIHPSHNTIRSVSIEYLSKLFCFTLPFIPGQSYLGKYLCDNQHKPFRPDIQCLEWRIKIDACIAQYIEEYKHRLASSPRKRVRSASPGSTDEMYRNKRQQPIELDT